jgi:hypothetical protein
MDQAGLLTTMRRGNARLQPTEEVGCQGREGICW